MANIKVDNVRGRTAWLSEQDEDGLYTWECNYGHTSDRRMNLADAVNDAEVHVDFQCEGR